MKQFVAEGVQAKKEKKKCEQARSESFEDCSG